MIGSSHWRVDDNCILSGRVHRMKDPGICSTERGFFWSSDSQPILARERCQWSLSATAEGSPNSAGPQPSMVLYPTLAKVKVSDV